MAGSDYIAGSVSVDVTPSFKGFQKAVAKHVQGLDDIVMKVRPEFNPKDWTPPELPAPKTDKAERKIGAFAADIQRKITAAIASLPEINLTADSSDADRAIAGIRTRLQAIADKRIGIDIDSAGALTEVNALERELNQLTMGNNTIQVRADTAAASSALGAIRRQAQALDNETIRIRAEADSSGFERGMSSIRSSMRSTSRSVTEGSDQMATSIRKFALLARGPGLATVPLGILQLPIALRAIGGASIVAVSALAALGVAGVTTAIALNGVGDALGALVDADEEAASSAASSAASRQASADAIADAERGVADAKRSAARTAIQSDRDIQNAREDLAEAHEDAARQIRAAEKTLDDAHRDARRSVEALTRAQEDLTQARKDAREEVQQLSFSVEGAYLSEQRAIDRLAEARKELAVARASGAGADEIRDLSLSVQEADLSLREASDRYKDLQAEGKEWARTGIEGSEGVQSAHQGVASAQQSMADAQLRIADAEMGLRQAQVEGTRSVAAATQSLAETQQAAAWAQQDSARAVADSNRQLARAMRDMGTEGSAAADKAREALDKLSPSARAVVLELDGVRKASRDMRMEIQERFFAQFAGDIAPLANQWLPMLETGLGRVSAGLGKGVEGFINWAGKSETIARTETLIDNVAEAIEGTDWTGWLDGMLILITGGSENLDGMSETIERWGEQFETWAKRVTTDGTLKKWVDDAKYVLSGVDDVVKGIKTTMDAIDSAKKTGDSAADWLNNLNENIDAAGLKTNKKMREDLGGLGEYFQGVKEQASRNWDTIVEDFRGLGGRLKGAGADMATFPGWVSGHFNTAKDWSIARFWDLVNWVRDLPNKINIAVQPLDNLRIRLGDFFGRAKDWAIAKFWELVDWMKGAPQRTFDALMGLNDLARRFGDWFGRAKDSAVAKFWELVDWCKGMGTRVGDAIGNLGSVLYQKGLDLMQGLWDGIKGKWNDIKGWFKDVIPGLAEGGPVIAAPRFAASGAGVSFMASGGPLHGGAPGKDSIPLMGMPGEYMLSVRAVKAMGGLAVVDAMHRAALSGRRMAGGGSVSGATAARGSTVPVAGTPGLPTDPTAIEDLTKSILALSDEAIKPLGDRLSKVSIPVMHDFQTATNLTDQTMDAATLSMATSIATLQQRSNASWFDMQAQTGKQAGTVAHQHLGGTLFTGHRNTELSTATLQQRSNASWLNMQQTTGSQIGTVVGPHFGYLATGHRNTEMSTAQLQRNSNASWLNMQQTTGSQVNTITGPIFSGLRAGMSANEVAVRNMSTTWRDQLFAMRAAAADPIRWIMQFPMGPPGIAASWNKLDAQFKLNKHLAMPVPNFRAGGSVHGPGTGTSDSVDAKLSNGEFVVRESIASKTLPFLHALNRGQAEAFQATGGGRIPPIRMAAGGAVDNAIRVAQSMNGKRYVWGGGGAGGTDCSGYMAFITRALRMEQNPYRRIGTTSTFPWPGFQPGLKSAFAIGNVRGSHMRGTLAGTNVEAGGSHRTSAYGGPAQGVPYGTNFHLPEAGGAFAPGGPGGGAAFDPTPIVNDAFKPTFDMIGDVTKFFGDSAHVLGHQNIAKQGADAVKAQAMQALAAVGGGAGGPAIGDVAGLNARQRQAAGTIIGVAKNRGMPRKAPEIGVATAMQESRLGTVGYGRAVDHDSLGLFQQRPSMGWGTPAQVQDDTYASNKFFDALAQQPYMSMSHTAAAQAVQRSAFGNAYAKWVPLAVSAVNAYPGGYDVGGIARGKGFLNKDIIEPERMLGPSNTRSFDTFVKMMRSGRLTVTGGASTYEGGNDQVMGDYHQHFYGADKVSQGFDALEHRMRIAKRGGGRRGR